MTKIIEIRIIHEMVTNDTRNNIMILILVLSVGVMVFYFMFSFSATMKGTADYSGKIVNETAKNVTTTFREVVDLITQQNYLQQQEQNESRKNLALFLNTFENQSLAQVNATKHLEHAVVDTLRESQNLTKLSQNLTQERINVETQTNQKLNALVLELNEVSNKSNVNNNQTH